MSVLEQVRALEQQVLQRLRELRPLVAEYRDLEKVAERLGLKPDDDAATGAALETTQPSRPSKPAATRKAKPAAGARRSKRAAARKPKATGAAAPKAAAKPKPRSTTSKPKAGAKTTVTAAAKAEPKPGAAGKPAAARPAARRATRNPKPGAHKRPAAAPGQRERDVLRLVGERPGVTVRELASELDVDATGLYGVVRRLQARGQLAKDGTELRLGGAAATTREPDTAAAPVATSDSTVSTTEQPPAGTARPPAGES